MSAFSLRPAVAEDAAAVTALHVSVWRRTYRDLAPPAVIGVLDEAYRLPLWTARIAAADAANPVILAECDGRLAGFAAGTVRAPLAVYEGRGEIGSLYVHGDFKRRGLGRLLLGTIRSALFDHGASGVGLGVVRGNDPAIAFYEASGGRIAGTYVDPGKYWPSDNLLMVWDR